MSVPPPMLPATTSKPTQFKPFPSCRRSSPLSFLTLDLPSEPPDPPDTPARAPPPPPLPVSNASHVPPLVTTHHRTSRNVEAIWSMSPLLHVSSVPSTYVESPPYPDPYSVFTLLSDLLAVVSRPDPPDPPDPPDFISSSWRLVFSAAASSSLSSGWVSPNLVSLSFEELFYSSTISIPLGSFAVHCCCSDEISTLKLPSKMATRIGDGGGLHVSACDTYLAHGLLYPMVYRSSIRSCFDLQTLFCKVPHSHLSSVIALYYAIVEWVRQLVVWMNLELRLCSLSGVILMSFASLVSILVYPVLYRSSAACMILYYFIALHQSCLGSRSPNHSCVELIFRLTRSLKLSVKCIWSSAVMEAPRFFCSFMNSYPDAQDSPVWQGFPSQYHDLIAFVAECLAFLGMSKIVCKSDCHELNCLLSESWSLDVLWILLAIRSLILCNFLWL